MKMKYLLGSLLLSTSVVTSAGTCGNVNWGVDFAGLGTNANANVCASIGGNNGTGGSVSGAGSINGVGSVGGSAAVSTSFGGFPSLSNIGSGIIGGLGNLGSLASNVTQGVFNGIANVIGFGSGWGDGGYTQTNYPIVLVHGEGGFDSVLGVVDYWYRIPKKLRAGGADVYVLSLSTLNNPEFSGELDAIPQINAIRNETGKQKVNLIAHGSGALVARYVAAVNPDIVASVTSVGSANRASTNAKGVNRLSDRCLEGESFICNTVYAATDLTTKVFDLVTFGADHQPANSQALVESLSAKALNEFNRTYTGGMADSCCGTPPESDANGVKYYSWSGTRQITHLWDPSDYVLKAASHVFHPGEKGDGIVERCQSHLGRIINDSYSMNHLDEINHIFGLHGIFSTDPLTVYRQHANRLKKANL